MATRVGDERKTSTIYGVPMGYYYYVIPCEKVYSATYLGYVDTIQSITYNPFIEENDIGDVVECSFNSDKYGIPDGGIPKCYRIESFDKIEKTLNEIDLFPTKPTEYDSFDFDPKLYLYPFTYYIITDYTNSPLLIKPQLVKTNDNKLRVKVKTTPLSAESKYNLYVDKYKGDGEGNLEGINNSIPLMLPVTSSVYSQFISNSMSSFTQGNINAMLENDKTLNQGLASNSLNYMINSGRNKLDGISSAISALLSLNVGSGFMAGTNYGFNKQVNEMQSQLTQNQLNENHQLTEYEINSMAQAKITDMLNTPNSIKTSGNDTLFNLINSNRKVDIIKYEPTAKIKRKISMYFERYGYRKNEYGKLSDYINSRKYFNYIKTNACNIATAKVPVKYLEEFKSIFNKGITIWHIDNGAEVHNYDVNNEEV